MDVKDGMLAEAVAEDRKLDFFKNNAKKTKARPHDTRRLECEENQRRKRRPKEIEVLQVPKLVATKVVQVNIYFYGRHHLRRWFGLGVMVFEGGY